MNKTVPPALIGIGIMLTASLLVTVNDALVKQALQTVDTSQVLFVRGVVATLAIMLFCFLTGRGNLFRIRDGQLVALLSILAVISLYLFTYSLQHIPLATAIVLAYTSPIFVCVLTPVLIRESVAVNQWIAVIVCFIGVFLVLSPTGGSFAWVLLLPVVVALVIALRDIVIRRYVRMENAMTLSIMVHVLTVLASGTAFEMAWIDIDAGTVMVLVAAGVTVAAGSTGMIVALKYASVASLSVVKYTCVLWGAIFGWVAFGETVTLLAVLGGLMIVLGGILITRHEARSF